MERVDNTHMVRHSLALGFAVLLLASGAPAQVTFVRAWDWYGNSKGNTVQQLDDGGYVVGAAAAESTDRIAPVLIRTDSLGDTLWTCMLHYKGKGFACQTADMDFVLVSDSCEGATPRPFVVATKVDQQGGIKWSRYYPPAGDLPRSVWPTAEGGVVVCGTFADHVGRGIGLKKLNRLGNQQWEKVLHHSTDTIASSGYSVEQTSDGGYILAGRLDDPENSRPFLVRADSLGDTVWTWSVVVDMPCQSASQTSDGGFIVTGSESDSVRRRASVYLMKFNPDGALVWHRSYGWGTGGFGGRCVRQVRDGGYVVVGICQTGMSFGSGAMVFRTDSLGDSLWLREFVYPSGVTNIFHWVEQTADGGFVMTGEVDYTLVLLVKTDSLGRVHGVGVADRGEGGRIREETGLQTVLRSTLVMPEVPVFNHSGPVMLLDASGRRVMKLRPGFNDIWHVAPGVYFIRGPETEDGRPRTAVRKVVVQR
jgi:hypothetical protein